jgi:hypothetical protein
MCEHGGQVDQSRLVVKSSRLHGRDLVPAEILAYDIETTGQRGIMEGSLITSEWSADRSGKRLLRISDFMMSLRSRLGPALSLCVNFEAAACASHAQRLQAPL